MTNIDIYEKKGNYEDLAWKVFRNINDNDVFLKVLYYPHITKEDYTALTNKFSEEYKRNSSNSRFTLMTTIGATIFSLYLSSAMRLKLTTFGLITIGSAVSTHYLLKKYYLNKMTNNVNSYASSIANKYSDIKYLIINYTTSDKLAKI
jgi:hypothetical protein